MKKSLPLLLLLPFAFAVPAAQYETQENPVPFRVTLRLDGAAPVSIERELAAGMKETVELNGSLLLELTAPANPLGYVMLRLLRRHEELSLPLHTARYPLREALTPRAYLVCGDEVSYYSPAGETLRDCSS